MQFDSATDMNEEERCMHSWGREECTRGGAGFCLFFKARPHQKVLSLVCQSLFAFLPKYTTVGKLNFDYLRGQQG